MTADIVTFPKAAVQRPTVARAASLSHTWTEQHLPLIDAAMDLLHADDVEFERRCRTIAETEGKSVLDQLAAQLDKLGTHVGDVVSALAMTAMRIRTTIATGGAGA